MSREHFSDDELDLMSAILDSMIGEYSATLTVHQQLWGSLPHAHYLEVMRSRAMDLREKIEARA